jgi:hypothetical protein
MSIYLKLNEARQQFHSRQLKKSGLNKFVGYKYFELGDFLIPAIEIFKKLNLCAIVSFDHDLATMTIVDIDDVSSKITITSPFGGAELKGCHEVQNIGATETYQRRYLWMAALEIVEHDAIDSSEGVDETDALMADVEKIRASLTPAELKVAFATSYNKYKANKKLLEPIMKAYEDMKAKLNATS